MNSESTSARPHDDRTVRGALAIFSQHGPARILMACFVAALAVRAVAGPPGWADLILVALLALFHPFLEWALHVFVLHSRPWRLFGRRYDLRWARSHRAHHRDPWDLRWVFMPMPQSGIALGLLVGLIGLAAPTWASAASAVVFVTGATLLYEWTHFLIHTHYKPRGWLYRRLWRFHRLHHFKNEHYWFGVTTHVADRILGTLPDRNAVATSETCRDLGISSPNRHEV